MKDCAPLAAGLMRREHLQRLRRHLHQENEMDFEFFYIRIDADEAEREVVARLWRVLMFRPDVARRVRQLCQSKELMLQPFADLLRRAIDAADWPEDFW